MSCRIGSFLLKNWMYSHSMRLDRKTEQMFTVCFCAAPVSHPSGKPWNHRRRKHTTFIRCRIWPLTPVSGQSVRTNDVNNGLVHISKLVDGYIPKDKVRCDSLVRCHLHILYLDTTLYCRQGCPSQASYRNNKWQLYQTVTYLIIRKKVYKCKEGRS